MSSNCYYCTTYESSRVECSFNLSWHRSSAVSHTLWQHFALMFAFGHLSGEIFNQFAVRSAETFTTRTTLMKVPTLMKLALSDYVLFAACSIMVYLQQGEEQLSTTGNHVGHDCFQSNMESSIAGMPLFRFGGSCNSLAAASFFSAALSVVLPKPNTASAGLRYP